MRPDLEAALRLTSSLPVHTHIREDDIGELKMKPEEIRALIEKDKPVADQQVPGSARASLDESAVLDARRYRVLKKFDLVSLHHATQTFDGISNLDAFCDAAMSAHEAAGKDR